jgi:hypothetical protein
MRQEARQERQDVKDYYCSPLGKTKLRTGFRTETALNTYHNEINSYDQEMSPHITRHCVYVPVVI